MTPPSPALSTDAELTACLSALQTDNTQPTPSRPSYRGGPALDPMTEDAYRFGWFGQADYDGHLGGGA